MTVYCISRHFRLKTAAPSASVNRMWKIHQKYFLEKKNPPSMAQSKLCRRNIRVTVHYYYFERARMGHQFIRWLKTDQRKLLNLTSKIKYSPHQHDIYTPSLCVCATQMTAGQTQYAIRSISFAPNSKRHSQVGPDGDVCRTEQSICKNFYFHYKTEYHNKVILTPIKRTINSIFNHSIH